MADGPALLARTFPASRERPRLAVEQVTLHIAERSARSLQLPLGAKAMTL